MFEHNELSGSLFKNKFKEAGSRQPDYKGGCKIGGVVYDIAGWIKQDKNGQNYFSFAFQVPRPRGEAATAPASRAEAEKIEEEELPF